MSTPAAVCWATTSATASSDWASKAAASTGPALFLHQDQVEQRSWARQASDMGGENSFRAQFHRRLLTSSHRADRPALTADAVPGKGRRWTAYGQARLSLFSMRSRRRSIWSNRGKKDRRYEVAYTSPRSRQMTTKRGNNYANPGTQGRLLLWPGDLPPLPPLRFAVVLGHASYVRLSSSV